MRAFRTIFLIFYFSIYPVVSYGDIELFGDNPIFAAIKANDLEGVKAAVNRGEKADVEDFDGRNEVIYAGIIGNADIIDFLGALRVSLTHRDKLGNSALYYAVNRGHVDAVEVLIEKGSLINSENRRGITPLMIAASQGRAEIVQILLKSGVDTSKRDYTGRTALMWAKWNKKQIIVNLLRSAGVRE